MAKKGFVKVNINLFAFHIATVLNIQLLNELTSYFNKLYQPYL